MTEASKRHVAWEHERLTPALERAPERQIRFSTLSDVEIERLYGPWDLAQADRDAIGLPGEPPFTRGIHPTGYRSRLWTMRMFAGFGAAEDTNARFRSLLGAGQTGLSIAYDMPTLYGYDTDDPEAEGEFGTCGVAVSSLADMEVLLDGLPLDKVSTSMTINSPAAPIWAMYIAAAEKRGVPRGVLEGTTQNDILKEFVAQKEYLFPPAPSMRLVTDTIEFGTRELPRWNTISISGYHIREAGSTAVQELAFTIADGMAYVEAALERGLRIDDFAPRLSFFFNSHSDFFEEIAKFRASRRVWYRLMTERYHAENERSTWMRFHTQTAGVSLTAQQPLNNLTRVAIQALAAVLGGTQSLHTDAYDEAWAVPSAEAALLALRQQQVIAEETGVTNTVDPLGGSWFVESLTEQTEQAVWRYIEEIDRRGGMVAAITEGYPQREIADAAYRFQREFDAGERGVVGVNRFADPDEELAIPLLQVADSSYRAQLSRLERTRRERDGEAVASALAGLRDAAGRPGTSDTNLMPHFLRCANAYATLGEQCGVLREVFGEYLEPVAVFILSRPSEMLEFPLNLVLALVVGTTSVRLAVAAIVLPRSYDDPMMYLDALEFLEEERNSFRPFEALDDLTDEQLQVPLEAAHGWSGRALMGHLTGGLEIALAAARELAVNDSSPSIVRWDAEWDAGGDAMNDRLLRGWAVLPMAEVRERFRNAPGELRGTLTVVPETRWLKHKTNMEWLMGETIDHYAEHEADLAAVLASAAG